MTEGTEILTSFVTTYKKVTKHRKKCKGCGKLITDGERVKMTKFKKTKWYPVKGLMGFVSWMFEHAACAAEEEC